MGPAGAGSAGEGEQPAGLTCDLAVEFEIDEHRGDAPGRGTEVADQLILGEWRGAEALKDLLMQRGGVARGAAGGSGVVSRDISACVSSGLFFGSASITSAAGQQR